jgi:hypothetical protein
MAKEKKKWWWILGVLLFIVYIFIAAGPISKETVLRPRWITSLESNYPISMGDFSFPEGEEQQLLPFRLGDRYGYVGDDGEFIINQIGKGYFSLSENIWAEYEAVPSSIRVMNPLNEPVLTIENPEGYPVFLDNRVFIVGREQNSLAVLGADGEKLWTCVFPAPLTCVDASGGYLLAGTLDGAVMLLDASGNPVFTPFEPGGSRRSAIYGCAISRDASRLAIISGLDKQRFLLLEQTGDTYRVIYHEFLSDGFTRPVHICFVDNDARVAFEREGGLGIFDINSRTSINLPLEGEIAVLDNSGGDRFLFVITSQDPGQKRFIAIRYPGNIVIEVPFKSDTAFFARRDSKLYIGGDSTMASLELGRK